MENEILARVTTSSRPPSLHGELRREEVPERVAQVVEQVATCNLQALLSPAIINAALRRAYLAICVIYATH